MNDYLKTFPKIKSNEIIPQNYKIKGCDGRFITYATYPINTFNNRDKTNLNSENITGWIGAWAEADLFTIDEQFNFIKELDIEPTYIVFSGNKSLHPAFIYDKKITNRKVQSQILKGLCVLLHGDPAVKNLDRSVRQPDYFGDDRQQPILKFSGLIYNAQDLLNNIENKVFERYNLKIDEAFARLEFYKKDKIKIVELPQIPQKSFSSKNYTWTTDLDDVYLTDKGTEITVREFIESNLKNQSLICRNPEHMEKNHSAYMIRNKDNVLIGCQGCDFKKVYKLESSNKKYEMLDIIEINQKYIDSELLKKYDNIILLSGTGTAKTTATKECKFIDQYTSLIISHLQNLSKNESSIFNTKFYQDKKGYIDLENIKSLSTCINSIGRIIGNPEFLFIDEVMQVLNSIVSGTVTDKEKIAVRLQEMIIEAKKIILADAHCDLYVLDKFLKPTGKRFTVIKNLYKSNRERILFNKEVNFYKTLDEKINNNEKCFIYCAAKAQADYFENYILKNHNKKCFNINGDTVAKYSDYFKNPNKLFNDIDIIVSSPSMGSGVSIESENINVFCHAESGEHVSALSLWQGMERVRKPLSTNIYIGTRNIKLLDDPSEIYNKELNSQINNDSYCIAIVNRKREFANKELILLFSEILAKDNFYKNNIRDEFYKLLQNDGIVKKSSIQSNAKETKDFQKRKQNDIKDVRINKSKKILDAKELTKEEYSDLSKNLNDGIYVSTEDLNSMKKFRYQKYFDLSEDLIYDLEYNGLLKKIYRFSNLICFENINFKTKLVQSDFDSDKESKWGNSKDPLYYSILEQFVNESEAHLLGHIRSYIYTGCALPLNSSILNTKMTQNLISGLPILSECDSSDINKFSGIIYSLIGIKTKRIQGKNKGYSIDMNSVKKMIELSKKIIEKNMAAVDIDPCLKEIFKKYSEEA